MLGGRLKWIKRNFIEGGTQMIKQIQLYTNHMDTIYEFYKEVLEFPVLDEKSASFQVGTSILSFKKNMDSCDPYYHFAFNITESSFEKSIEWLKSKRIHINLIDENKKWNSHSIYFYDPAGNIVEFIARHNLKSNSTGDFTVQDILNISEIGFPSHDVRTASTHLITEYGVDTYKSVNDVFASLGTEEGLFILSSLDRHWKGSSKKVAIFPLEVTIEGNKDDEQMFLDYPYKITSITTNNHQ